MNKIFPLLMTLFSLNSMAADITLTKDNTITLNAAIDESSTSSVMDKAQAMDSKMKSNDPIYLVLYSPGGSIQAGLDLIAFLKSLNRPVHTITIFSASMAFQTVQQLGNRYILPFGTLMAHKARGGFQGEFPGQIDSRYTYYVKRLTELDRMTVARTAGKHTIKSFQELYENEYWVDGFDATKQGLADDVVNAHCDQSLKGTHDEFVNFMGFTIKVVYSDCPTIVAPVSIEAMVQTDQGLMTIDEFLAKGGALSGNVVSSWSGATESIFGPSKPVVSKAAPKLTVDSVSMENINKELLNVRKVKTERPQVIKGY